MVARLAQRRCAVMAILAARNNTRVADICSRPSRIVLMTNVTRCCSDIVPNRLARR